MKVVRMQIDLIYLIEDDKAQEMFEKDDDFVKQLEASFWSWPDREDEVRIPDHFEGGVTLGEYEEEGNQENNQTT